MTPQFDLNGSIAAGAKLYVVQAGTVSTPQNPYFDSALTILAPNPLIADASGRINQFFLSDGFIKLRLVNANGDQIFVGDNLLVIGPSSGGGGGGTVDPTTILATGDFKLSYGTGILSGFVRANGRTIGNATSGATERANADTSALFAFLWNNDSTLAVSGGRGASAAADYAANKTIALPDFRNGVPAGLGDMGNSDAGLFSGVTFSKGSSTQLGSVLGAARQTLLTANLPPYTPSGSIAMTTGSGGTAPAGVPSGQIPAAFTSGSGNAAYITANFFNLIATLTGTAQGGTSTPVTTTQPTILVTFYLKL